MSDGLNQRAPQRAPVVAVNVREFLLWMCGRRIRVRVDGASMEPALYGGSTVLVRPMGTASVGDVVLCRHPYRTDTRILKRVAELREDGVYVLGDNPNESTDSRSFGVVPWSHLVGLVTSRMNAS